MIFELKNLLLNHKKVFYSTKENKNTIISVKNSQYKFISTFRFPKDAKTRSEWFKFCELTEGVDQVSCITICSLHFTADDFNFPKLGCKGAKILSLKSGAIPSVRIGGKKQHKTKAFTNDSNTESLCMTDLNDLDLNLGNYNCDNGETGE